MFNLSIGPEGKMERTNLSELLDLILNSIQTFKESFTISRVPGTLELIQDTRFGEQQRL